MLYVFIRSLLGGVVLWISTMQTMELQNSSWRTIQKYSFSPRSKYHDYYLSGDPVPKRGLALNLYGYDVDKNLIALPLFDSFSLFKPIMDFSSESKPFKTIYVSLDKKHRVVVSHEPSGEHVITTYSFYQPSRCKNLCNILTTWLRSCCRKKQSISVQSLRKNAKVIFACIDDMSD